MNKIIRISTCIWLLTVLFNFSQALAKAKYAYITIHTEPTDGSFEPNNSDCRITNCSTSYKQPRAITNLLDGRRNFQKLVDALNIFKQYGGVASVQLSPQYSRYIMSNLCRLDMSDYLKKNENCIDLYLKLEKDGHIFGYHYHSNVDRNNWGGYSSDIKTVTRLNKRKSHIGSNDDFFSTVNELIGHNKETFINGKSITNEDLGGAGNKIDQSVSFAVSDYSGRISGIKELDLNGMSKFINYIPCKIEAKTIEGEKKEVPVIPQEKAKYIDWNENENEERSLTKASKDSFKGYIIHAYELDDEHLNVIRFIKTINKTTIYGLVSPKKVIQELEDLSKVPICSPYDSSEHAF